MMNGEMVNMTKPAAKQRLYRMDHIKLLAAYFVVLIHSLFPGNLGVAVKAVARFAVPFFFLCSGFFLYGNKPESIMKKALHILKLFLVTAVVYLVVSVALFTLQRDFAGLRDYLYSLMGEPPAETASLLPCWLYLDFGPRITPEREYIALSPTVLSGVRNGEPIEEGYRYIDNCVQWCRENGLHIILDIHKTYGYSFDPLDKDDKTIFFTDPGREKRFLDMGFNRVFPPGTSPETAIDAIREILKMPATDSLE